MRKAIQNMVEDQVTQDQKSRLFRAIGADAATPSDTAPAAATSDTSALSREMASLVRMMGEMKVEIARTSASVAVMEASIAEVSLQTQATARDVAEIKQVMCKHGERLWRTTFMHLHSGPIAQTLLSQKTAGNKTEEDTLADAEALVFGT